MSGFAPAIRTRRSTAPLALALLAALACAPAGAAPRARKGDGQHASAAAPAPAPAPASDGGAPGFVVMDLPAIRQALKGSRGHAVLVHFWATWCLPCLEELPVVEKLARDVKPRGVDVLSLSLDDPEQAGARVSKLLAEVAPSLTRSIARIDDADSFIGSFGTWEGSIPALFAFDAEGQLRGSLIGETNRRALDDLVGRALKPRARAPR